jgi:Fic family protein
MVSMPTSVVYEEGEELVGRGALVRRHWNPDYSALGGRSARRGFDYQAFIPRPIADEDFLLPSQVAELASAAERATRQLNDNPPRIGNLEALARQLLRAESVASSRIEGLVLSHRRLARAAFAPERHDENAQLVLQNIAALEEAVELAASVEILGPKHIRDLHEILFRGTRDEHYAGVIREEQNWIGGRATNPSDAEFIPPPPEYVERLLEDLCLFANRGDVQPIIQAAVVHAQFETIHPFVDGNGRVGRALIHVILRRREVAPLYVPPISLVLAGEAQPYVSALQDFRFASETSWFEIFSDAVRRAAIGADDFADRVAALQQRWLDEAGNPRAGSTPRLIIESLPASPIIDQPRAEEITGAAREAVRLGLLRLEEAGVIRQLNVGRQRGRVWESVGLFDLLDSFEREMGPEHRAPRHTRGREPSRRSAAP